MCSLFTPLARDVTGEGEGEDEGVDGGRDEVRGEGFTAVVSEGRLDNFGTMENKVDRFGMSLESRMMKGTVRVKGALE